MNVLFSAIVNSLLQNRRTCPKCGNSQTVPKDRKQEAVICKTCGAEIPPPR